VVVAVAVIETLPDEPPVPPDTLPPQALNNPVIDNTLAKSKPIRLECFTDSFPRILIFKTAVWDLPCLPFRQVRLSIQSSLRPAHNRPQPIQDCICLLSHNKH
jgi:hypothetical protein